MKHIQKADKERRFTQNDQKCITIVLTLSMILSTFTCAFGEEAGTDPAPRVIETSDGVLSIDAPSDAWQVTTDPNYWFAMTDGMDTITIEHLANGENLPATVVADETYGAVYQAFVSTRNEVFVVKGSAARAEDLESIMKSIGTIKILQFKYKDCNQQRRSISFRHKYQADR